MIGETWLYQRHWWDLGHLHVSHPIAASTWTYSPVPCTLTTCTCRADSVVHPSLPSCVSIMAQLLSSAPHNAKAQHYNVALTSALLKGCWGDNTAGAAPNGTELSWGELVRKWGKHTGGSMSPYLPLRGSPLINRYRADPSITRYLLVILFQPLHLFFRLYQRTSLSPSVGPIGAAGEFV
jgi:hypothetical protein